MLLYYYCIIVLDAKNIILMAHKHTHRDQEHNTDGTHKLTEKVCVCVWTVNQHQEQRSFEFRQLTGCTESWQYLVWRSIIKRSIVVLLRIWSINPAANSPFLRPHKHIHSQTVRFDKRRAVRFLLKVRCETFHRLVAPIPLFIKYLRLVWGKRTMEFLFLAILRYVLPFSNKEVWKKKLACMVVDLVGVDLLVSYNASQQHCFVRIQWYHHPHSPHPSNFATAVYLNSMSLFLVCRLFW